MSQFYDLASLVVIPSGYKASTIYAQKPLTTDGQLSFTRASGATRVASNGLIEKVRTNLLTYSEQFDNAIWEKLSIPVTANAGIAPDGTNTADKITPTSSLTQHLIYYDGGGTLFNGDYSLSVFVKASGYSKVALRESFSTGIYASFNLTTSTVIDSSPNQTNTITNVGNGWYRISFTASATITANLGIIALPDSYTTGDPFNSFAGDDTSGVLVWGAQLEIGVPTPYIPTTTAAVSVGPVSNVPRLDYLGSSCPRLLLEPQRTNLVTFSEQIDNAAWSKLFLGVTANNASSPDGTTNAEKLIPDATLNTHLFFQTLTPAAGVYTQSAFFKAGEYNFACLRLATDSDTKRYAVVLNLTTGVITATDSLGSPTSTSSKVENYGNGWYRLSISSEHTSGTMFPTFAVSSTAVPTFSNSLPFFTGDATSGIFAYGCQLELGAYATSYIPTLGASVTRVADAASKTGISSLIGQTEGTLFVEINSANLESYTQRIFTASDDTNNNVVGLQLTGANQITFYVENGGVNQAVITKSAPAITLGQNVKIAAAYKANDFVLYVNGIQVGTDASGSVPATSVLRYANPTGTNPYIGKVAQSLLFKTRLTNAQLAELTTL
jgi:hypothetical protein